MIEGFLIGDSMDSVLVIDKDNSLSTQLLLNHKQFSVFADSTQILCLEERMNSMFRGLGIMNN